MKHVDSGVLPGREGEGRGKKGSGGRDSEEEGWVGGRGKVYRFDKRGDLTFML